MQKGMGRWGPFGALVVVVAFGLMAAFIVFVVDHSLLPIGKTPKSVNIEMSGITASVTVYLTQKTRATPRAIAIPSVAVNVTSWRSARWAGPMYYAGFARNRLTDWTPMRPRGCAGVLTT